MMLNEYYRHYSGVTLLHRLVSARELYYRLQIQSIAATGRHSVLKLTVFRFGALASTRGYYYISYI